MKCTTLVLIFVIATKISAQPVLQSWAGNTTNVNVNCPVILIGDQCPAWANPGNAAGVVNSTFATNTQILTSLGTDSLRCTNFNFGSPEPLTDPQDITAARVQVLFDQSSLLLNIGLLSATQLRISYSNPGNPSLNRIFNLSGSSLADVNLLGLELSLLSAEIPAVNLDGLTVADVKEGNWIVNFRLSGLSLSLVTVLSVDAIQLEFDYEEPLSVQLISQTHEFRSYDVDFEWKVQGYDEDTYFTIQSSTDAKHWKDIATPSPKHGTIHHTMHQSDAIGRYFRLLSGCAVHLTAHAFPIMHISHQSSPQVSMYPNPRAGGTPISIASTSDIAKLEIFTSKGTLVDQTHHCQAPTCEWRPRYLPPGLYIVKVAHSNHQLSHHRMIVYE